MSNSGADSPGLQRPQRARRRWRSVVGGVIVIGILVLWLRNGILTSLASMLVVSESAPDATALLVLTGETRFDEAARFALRDPSHRILIEEPRPGRLVRLRILPSIAEQGRNGLQRRGVPEDQIEVVSWSGENETLASSLARWLQQHPDVRVLVVCDAFSSRDIRWTFDRLLPPDQARRLALRPLSSQAYGADNWWHSKPGIRAFCRGWTSLLLPLVHRHRKEWRECNPELFQPAR